MTEYRKLIKSAKDVAQYSMCPDEMRETVQLLTTALEELCNEAVQITNDFKQGLCKIEKFQPYFFEQK